jgi:nucleotide-binding universal stress UspA family protein
MRILIALDGSPLSELAVAAVAPFAREAGMEVDLLMVLDPDEVHETFAETNHVTVAPRAAPFLGQLAGRMATPLPRSAEDRNQALERARVEAEEYLQAQAAKYLVDVICDVHVEWSGETAAAVAAFAGESRADLIAMGTHGRSGLSHVLMGSVAEEVVRRSPVPVVVVRQGMHLAAGGPSEVRGKWHTEAGSGS